MGVDRIAQEWHIHGFVILPGAIPAGELSPAVIELEVVFHSAGGFHDGTDPRAGASWATSSRGFPVHQRGTEPAGGQQAPGWAWPGGCWAATRLASTRLRPGRSSPEPLAARRCCTVTTSTCWYPPIRPATGSCRCSCIWSRMGSPDRTYSSGCRPRICPPGPAGTRTPAPARTMMDSSCAPPAHTCKRPKSQPPGLRAPLSPSARYLAPRHRDARPARSPLHHASGLPAGLRGVGPQTIPGRPQP
jgi:hypothetical protein